MTLTILGEKFNKRLDSMSTLLARARARAQVLVLTILTPANRIVTISSRAKSTVASEQPFDPEVLMKKAEKFAGNDKSKITLLALELFWKDVQAILVKKDAEVAVAVANKDTEVAVAKKDAEVAVAKKDAEVAVAKKDAEMAVSVAKKDAEVAVAKKDAEMAVSVAKKDAEVAVAQAAVAVAQAAVAVANKDTELATLKGSLILANERYLQASSAMTARGVLEFVLRAVHDEFHGAHQSKPKFNASQTCTDLDKASRKQGPWFQSLLSCYEKAKTQHPTGQIANRPIGQAFLSLYGELSKDIHGKGWSGPNVSFVLSRPE
jgi:predicted RNA-binding protein Jag